MRNLERKDAKIWTTPYSAAQSIIKETDKGHTYLMIQRNGIRDSTTTTYTVLNAMQIDDEDWGYLLPNISKQELTKLQSEEKFDPISDEELHRLETLGVKEDEQ